MKWQIQQNYKPILEDWQVKTNNSLTLRQLQIMYLTSHGLRPQDIAHACGIKQHTVKNHYTAIFNIVGVKNAKELVLYIFNELILPEV